MLKIIQKILQKLIDDIDSGNSNLSEEEALEIISNLKRLTDKERGVSKYSACQYLKISRATFDNYIKDGKIPKGEHMVGFKELSWKIKDLDIFIEKYKKDSV